MLRIVTRDTSDPIVCDDGWVVAYVSLEEGVWFRGPEGSVLHTWEDGRIEAHGVTLLMPVIVG